MVQQHVCLKMGNWHLSQSRIVFLFLELSTNYIFHTEDYQYRYTIWTYIFQIYTSFALFLVERLLQNVVILMQKLAVIVLTC